MKKWIGLGILALIVIFILAAIGSVTSTYNSLVTLDQQVRAQWAQVENVYQRRYDLIPNLVATVKGAANFEKSTYIAVTKARSQVGRITPGAMKGIINDPKTFAKFESAQNQLGSALSRLLVTVEHYPNLKATQNFLDLQAQLEGTENRIAQERRLYNLAAQGYNTRLQTFPTNIIAGFFGGKFTQKPYFKSVAGAAKPPKVNFGQ